MPVSPIKRLRAADAVTAQLRSLISEGELAVGDRLPSEEKLARSFGVSRPIVREGLGALRSVGMLESRSGAGTFVRSASPAPGGLLLAGGCSSDELYEARTHIEIPGAGLAARRRTKEQLGELGRIVERHTHTEDAEDWVGDDLLFHVTLARATGNSVHVRLVSELAEVQSELTRAMARLADGLAPPEVEHARILSAIRRRDEKGARSAMAAHLAAIHARLQALEP